MGARVAAGALLLLVAAGGCTKQEMQALGVGKGNVPKTPQEVLAAEGCKVDVTEAESRQFADKLIAALDQRRLADVNRMIDYDVLLRIAVRGASSQSTADEFRKAALQGLNSTDGGLFSGPLSENAAYRLLRIVDNPRGRQLLVRTLAESGSVNYFELSLVRSKSGQPVVVDAYIYTIGELYSDTLRRLYLTAAGQSSQIFSVPASEAEIIRGAKCMEAMTRNYDGGRFAEVVAEYQRLPEAFKRERIYLILRMHAASEVSNDEYLVAMADIRKYHGDADWANMLLMDDDVLRKNFDSALRRIDRTDGQVGGDPYLEVVRAGTLSEKKEFAAALAAAERCVKAEPTLVQGHQAAANMGLLAKRYDVVRRELLVLEKQFQVNVDDQVNSDEFAPFRASDDFGRWQADRSNR
jgi:hypothetical protein